MVFLPDYRVSLAEQIIPAADRSEQISTAGMEASGTGNMKLALNGALTVGTLDGTNLEMLEAIGHDHMFIFGLNAEQVAELRAGGHHDPLGLLPRRRRTPTGFGRPSQRNVCGGDSNLLHDLWASLMHHGDRCFLLPDFRSYLEAQDRAARLYCHRRAWAAAAIRNIAAMGRFSSDRSVQEYADLVWQIHPVPVNGQRP